MYIRLTCMNKCNRTRWGPSRRCTRRWAWRGSSSSTRCVRAFGLLAFLLDARVCIRCVNEAIHRPGHNTPTNTHHKINPPTGTKNTHAGGLVQGDHRGAGRAAVVAAAARVRDPPQEDLQALQVKRRPARNTCWGWGYLGHRGWD